MAHHITAMEGLAGVFHIELDYLVQCAWRDGTLAGQRLRYNAATEQIFFHYPDSTVVHSAVYLRGTRRCSDGTGYDEYAPRHPPAAGFDAVIHTHQDRAPREIAHHPFPGTRDGVTPKRHHIPNYGISSVGAWVVRPGLVLWVELLAGTWGERFNPEAFAKALNRGQGDVAVGTGVVCR